MPTPTQSFALQKQDMVYVFSDGFADQFGGPSQKKFMRKALKELLVHIATDNHLVQREKLLQAFSAWRGEGEQTDDVLVIGVRIV